MEMLSTSMALFDEFLVTQRTDIILIKKPVPQTQSNKQLDIQSKILRGRELVKCC